MFSEHLLVAEFTGAVWDRRKLTEHELKKVMFAFGMDGLLPKVKMKL